ncbi:uncharacterized protein [Bos taurus]|uniref:uncharacterized protein isoform X1 n=1 Tax=Bos taurus TaxID=9913 RepID=UPI0028CB3F14|nr:uncharacterized protein LOC101907127 isoform X1 [Bos taurus]
MNQSTPEKHNASSARCLGLRSGVGCAPERALLPQPPHPRNGIAPRGQSPALGGVGRDRGALGPRRRPHRWAPYRVLVPGAEPGLPGDCCPGDAAGGSRSDGRARASGRRRGARGGLRAGPRRGAGPLECSLEFIARNFNLGHSGAQTAEESVKFRVTPACPTPGAEESGLSGIPPPPRVPGEAPKGGPPVRAQGASLHPRAWEKGRRNTPTEVPWNLEEAWYARTRRTSPGKPRGSRRSLRTVPSTPVRAVGEEKGFRIGGSPSVSRHRMSHMRTLACTFTHIHTHSGTVT